MFNYINKIDTQLLDVVSTQGNKKIECVIYANNFCNLKKILDNNNSIPLPFINAYAVKLDANKVYEYAKNNVVKYITKQSKVFAQIDVSRDILNVNKFYEQNYSGKGVTVAIIDTGISLHTDFTIAKKRIIKFVDLINDKNMPYDDNGHGTFVASILAGNGIASGGRYSGIAPECNIISIKALEKNGETSSSNILRAMQWIYDNKDKYNIKVVCMSFGSTPSGRNDPLQMGAEVLWNSGVTVVAAAGNSGPERESIKSPGISPKIITVGGIDDKRVDGKYDIKSFEIAKFSSRGPAGYFYKPDCLAPAIDITGASVKGGYTTMSGTSVATPMVAGIATLMYSKNNQISPDQIKVKLLRNCKQIVFDRNQEGFGLVSISII